MIIGIPKEIKDNESRVAITPAGVKELVSNGKKVLIETGAGIKSGISDEAYKEQGAEIAKSAEELFRDSDMIIKVKEPLSKELDMLREGHLLFTFLHLASDVNLAKRLAEKKVTAIAYETVENDDGHLPLLFPMSEIAGKLSVQAGAYYLQKNAGGRGILLGGVPGVSPANVLVIGAGAVGSSAVKIAVGMGAQVTVLDKKEQKLVHLDELYSGNIKTLMANEYNLSNEIINADLVIGAVLVTGAKAPMVISKDMVGKMKKGAVIVDVSIDQGGCMETSRPTSYSDPIYTVDGVLHYCVTNMPGAVSMTSTYALTNATLGYAVKIAKLGFKKAIMEDSSLKRGVNVMNGCVTNKAVADSLDLEYNDIDKCINEL
jgi:alanine dehydrogenase